LMSVLKTITCLYEKADESTDIFPVIPVASTLPIVSLSF
jgi:hypothetical protein